MYLYTNVKMYTNIYCTLRSISAISSASGEQEIYICMQYCQLDGEDAMYMKKGIDTKYKRIFTFSLMEKLY